MSRTQPSPVTEGDTTNKRTAAEATCRNDNAHCPHENPAVDRGLECFDCWLAIHRVDERPAHVPTRPYAGF